MGYSPCEHKRVGHDLATKQQLGKKKRSGTYNWQTTSGGKKWNKINWSTKDRQKGEKTKKVP